MWGGVCNWYNGAKGRALKWELERGEQRKRAFVKPLHRLFVSPSRGNTKCRSSELRHYFCEGLKQLDSLTTSKSALQLRLNGLLCCSASVRRALINVSLCQNISGLAPSTRQQLNPSEQEAYIMQSVRSVSSWVRPSDLRVLCHTFTWQQLHTVWWWLNVSSYLIWWKHKAVTESNGCFFLTLFSLLVMYHGGIMQVIRRHAANIFIVA